MPHYAANILQLKLSYPTLPNVPFLSHVVDLSEVYSSQAVGLEKTTGFALRFELAPVLKYAHIFSLRLLKGTLHPHGKKRFLSLS
jgi:uncharacterized protein YlaN (UPF0358 family)